jgi:hypothetical protein
LKLVTFVFPAMAFLPIICKSLQSFNVTLREEPRLPSSWRTSDIFEEALENP